MNKKILLGAGVAVGLAALIGFGLLNGAAVVRAASQAGRVLSMVQQAVANVKGLVVVNVEADSPADKAGVKRGDIVLKVGDTEVNNLQELRAALDSSKVGDKVTLALTRGDKDVSVTVTLGDRNGQPFLGIGLMGGPGGRGIGIWGRTPMITNTITMTAPQVLVVSVVTDSPADKAGIKPGDLILKVDGKAIGTDLNLADLIGKYQVGDIVTLDVTTPGEASREVKVTLADNPNKKGTPYLGVRFALEPGFGRGKRGGGRDGMMPFGIGGAAVQTVTANSPADKAGIKQGDTILSLNGKTLGHPMLLAQEIASLKVGDEVTLSVKHQGETAATDIKVTLGDNPDKKGTPWLGITFGGAMRMRPGRGIEGMPGGQMFRLPGADGTNDIQLPIIPNGDTL